MGTVEELSSEKQIEDKDLERALSWEYTLPIIHDWGALGGFPCQVGGVRCYHYCGISYTEMSQKS